MSLESSSPRVSMVLSTTGQSCQQESLEGEIGKSVYACEFL